MDYNKFELNQIRRIKRTKYSELEEWEKFYIKENQKLWRSKKKQMKNELSVDSGLIDIFYDRKQRKTSDDYLEEGSN